MITTGLTAGPQPASRQCSNRLQAWTGPWSHAGKPDHAQAEQVLKTQLSHVQAEQVLSTQLGHAQAEQVLMTHLPHAQASRCSKDSAEVTRC